MIRIHKEETGPYISFNRFAEICDEEGLNHLKASDLYRKSKAIFVFTKQSEPYIRAIAQKYVENHL